MMVFYLPTLLFLFFLSIPSFRLSYSIQNNTIFCPEIEKQSLLSFKNSLNDPYKLLSSWDGKVNCCNWNGVTCNNLTGHVHKLTVQGNFFHQYPVGLIGKLNPSLLNLKHLTYLDLSRNSFAETIPTFIGSFLQLKYLDLSYAGFHGKIPHDIGNLSSLHTLGLETDDTGYFPIGQLYVDNLEWLSGLRKLENLNMNSVNLSKATNWAQVINTLPSLIVLHLDSCSLDFSAPLNDLNTTSSLTLIHLSYNNFKSSAVLRWILQLSSLVFLDLSGNSFEGPIPPYCNASKLQHVDLSINNFNFSIPDWLFLSKDLVFVDMRLNSLNGTISNGVANLTSLSYFHLGRNQLSGKIPKELTNLCKIKTLYLYRNNLHGDFFGNMSECFLASLQDLSFAANQISGNLTDQIGEFKSLESLDLSFNLLSGAIPTNLGKLMSLSSLFLNGNKFIGNLPESLGQLFNLYELYIDDNMLEGVVTEIHFANLTKLRFFYASYNHNLTLDISPNWIPPFQLEILRLSSWNFDGVGSEAPSWLENQKKSIGELDLSNTGISFNVPSWFWNIRFLNLSHNYLHGKIPSLHGTGDRFNGQMLYLSCNRFSGLLPQVGDTVSELDLSNNSFSGGMSHFLCDMTFETYRPEILHLGGNQLSGELPDCWLKWPFLIYLNLGNNNLSGSIPHSIGYLRYLESLNLNNNKFSGQIPFAMHNCTALVKIDLANNDLDGSIPAWVGTSLINLRFLILRSNKLSGNISSSICCLNSLQILDLSSNKISGSIPSCVFNFTAMTTKRSLVDDYGGWKLTYSTYVGLFLESAVVATKGHMLQYDTILALVTNIDLSKNNLSGDIPEELTSLLELRSLNLSNNHLNGVIPDNIGDMRQLECLDLSVNSLSGQIPNSFKLLSSLDYLNLSFNKLIGEIPESTQISGFDAWSFIGNNLCGTQLRRNCSHDDGEHRVESEGDEPEIEWLYVLLSLGFAVGFSGVCTTLVWKKPWRDAYFGLLECIWDKAYVHVYIKWRRLTKPSAPNS